MRLLKKMKNCNWCGLRSDPPIFCNEECEEEYNKGAEKYFKMMSFLLDHINFEE